MEPREPEFMQELHKIREEHYEATKHLSAEELVQEINSSAEQGLAEYGYELIPSPTGQGRIIVRRKALVAGQI